MIIIKLFLHSHHLSNLNFLSSPCVGKRYLRSRSITQIISTVTQRLIDIVTFLLSVSSCCQKNHSLHPHKTGNFIMCGRPSLHLYPLQMLLMPKILHHTPLVKIAAFNLDLRSWMKPEGKKHLFFCCDILRNTTYITWLFPSVSVYFENSNILNGIH